LIFVKESSILKMMKKGILLIGAILVIVGTLWLLAGQKKEIREEKIMPTETVSPVLEEGGEEEKLKMKNQKLKILMVVAPKNFRDEELFAPKKVLAERGIGIEIASKGVTEAEGMLGGKTSVDKDLSEVRVDDYDGLIFVGGSGASIYFNDPQALSLAKQAYEEEKIVGAICIAPSILANSGILQGKKATSFSSEAENLKSRGADYTGEGVTVDGEIITAQGPDFASQFGEKIAEMLQ